MTLADTSYWVALALSRDAHHAVATRLARQMPTRIVVTNHVRGETWTFLRRRGGHRVATDFLDRIDADPRIEIATVTPEVEADAWRWLRRHDERAYSFVDAVSFAVMRRRRIREALAFDGDFTAAGFIELRA